VTDHETHLGITIRFDECAGQEDIAATEQATREGV